MTTSIKFPYAGHHLPLEPISATTAFIGKAAAAVSVSPYQPGGAAVTGGAGGTSSVKG
jgi:hypothetical protein